MDSILNCCICFVIVKYQKPRTNIGQCLKVWRPSPDSRLSAAVILRLLIFSFVPSWTRQTCVHGKLFWSVNKVCWVIPRWWWSLQSTETVSSVIWHHRCLVPQWNTIWHRRCTLAGNWVNARGKPMAGPLPIKLFGSLKMHEINGLRLTIIIDTLLLSFGHFYWNSTENWSDMTWAN